MLTRIVAATGQLRLGQRLPLTSRLGVTGTGRVHTRPDRGVATTATSASDTLAALNNGHPLNNVPSSVKDLVGRDLHRQPAHPLCLIKSAIHTHMTTGATDASDTAKAGASGSYYACQHLVSSHNDQSSLHNALRGNDGAHNDGQRSY